jgi:hypothetical protein
MKILITRQLAANLDLPKEICFFDEKGTMQITAEELAAHLSIATQQIYGSDELLLILKRWAMARHAAQAIVDEFEKNGKDILELVWNIGLVQAVQFHLEPVTLPDALLYLTCVMYVHFSSRKLHPKLIEENPRMAYWHGAYYDVHALYEISGRPIHKGDDLVITATWSAYRIFETIKGWRAAPPSEAAPAHEDVLLLDPEESD